MRTLINDFLPQIRPRNITVFATHWTIKLIDLASNVYNLIAIRFQSALTIRAVEAIDLLNSHVYNLHAITLFLG